MNVAEMMYVLRQYQDGKQIQWRFKGFGNWEDCTNRDGPDWAFNTRDYRVKPGPREWTGRLGEYGIYFDKLNYPDQPQIKVREVLE